MRTATRGQASRCGSIRTAGWQSRWRRGRPDRNGNATPPSSWKISSPARSARGASWPMPAPQTATVTAGPPWWCFVQPAIDPGLGWPQGLDAALARAVRTMSMGGGVGYDFSPVPPADSGAGRGGACAVIDRYDQACQALATPAGGGARADGRAGLRSSRPARLPARQGRTAPLADPEPVGRAERPLPCGPWRTTRRGPCAMPARRRADGHHSEACVATMEPGPMPACRRGGCGRR